MAQQDNTGGVQGERTLPSKINSYYELHVPASGSRPLLIALHGYGSNKRHMMKDARAMVPDTFAVASLQGIHQHLKEPREPGAPIRYGFGWLTNFHPEESIGIHHQAILDLIKTLTDEGIADPERVFLLGFSQTCALNFRFAFTFPDVLRGVIGICGGLPGDWETSKSYKHTDASVLYLHGTRDEVYPPERVRDYQLMLAIRSRMVQSLTYDAGHEITQEMRDDIRRWLGNRTVRTAV
jgi:phospholipase/carboxylesterase